MIRKIGNVYLIRVITFKLDTEEIVYIEATIIKACNDHCELEMINFKGPIQKIHNIYLNKENLIKEALA